MNLPNYSLLKYEYSVSFNYHLDQNPNPFTISDDLYAYYKRILRKYSTESQKIMFTKWYLQYTAKELRWLGLKYRIIPLNLYNEYRLYTIHNVELLSVLLPKKQNAQETE